jgi:hypothetical protein
VAVRKHPGAKPGEAANLIYDLRFEDEQQRTNTKLKRDSLKTLNR